MGFGYLKKYPLEAILTAERIMLQQLQLEQTPLFESKTFVQRQMKLWMP